MTMFHPETTLFMAKLTVKEGAMVYRLKQLDEQLKKTLAEKSDMTDYLVNQIRESSVVVTRELAEVRAAMDALEKHEVASRDIRIESRGAKLVNGLPATLMVAFKGEFNGQKISVTRHLRLQNGQYVGRGLLKDGYHRYDGVLKKIEAKLEVAA